MIIWKNIELVEPGEIVGEDVYDPSGFIILIKEGSVLKEGDIYLLKNRGVNILPIYVEEVLTSEDIEPTIDMESYDNLSKDLSNTFEEVKNGELNVKKVVKHSEEIMKKVLEKYNEKILNLIRKDQKPLARHAINTGVISSIIGISLGFDDETLNKLIISAILHDVAHEKPVRDIIEYYDTHPIKATGMLRKHFNMNDDVLLSILHHHERFDGKGYPRNLKGTSIPVFARILSIADAYDTLISKDFPGKAFSPYETVKFIISNSGKMFDPNIVSKFVQYVGIYPTGTVVELSNGERGVVVKVLSGLIPLVKANGRLLDLVKEKIYIKKVIN
ncbi:MULTISPECIES: HD domain-containing phosphohydrolase [unclassified Thermosipho (in: thermotogales)]|uniref:HD-GYP domain-containing protein n=1 Tax=unclassified Thermosipho (in: thermotogales) TaxID=2676525 RepID=UPI0009858E93|nr:MULTISPECIES: HD domain-containing phosphohydrolase [unclassified Thermosipho (in: thermotogales)]MBT1247834.1 phosphohydrolase [Thermosipho sp. 1244]OOC45465.1 phosphohydrolase [Thermosipho sp. 1223]